MGVDSKEGKIIMTFKTHIGKDGILKLPWLPEHSIVCVVVDENGSISIRSISDKKEL
jgi:hypothetical protein